jgi:hypothetical protein
MSRFSIPWPYSRGQVRDQLRMREPGFAFQLQGSKSLTLSFEITFSTVPTTGTHVRTDPQLLLLKQVGGRRLLITGCSMF